MKASELKALLNRLEGDHRIGVRVFLKNRKGELVAVEMDAFKWSFETWETGERLVVEGDILNPEQSNIYT